MNLRFALPHLPVNNRRYSRVPLGATSLQRSADWQSAVSPIGNRQGREHASTFVIVLWIAFGLVSLALYFGQSMSFELRAADSRVSGLAAEQAIDAAIRYLTYNFMNLQTNGIVPDPATYLREAVPVGDSHFWLIGRDTNDASPANFVSFGLIDEASKLNLNAATSNMLYFLPRMNVDLTASILDWRDTNGGTGSFSTYYGMMNPPFQNKSAPFDTVEELKLCYGADLYTLVGEDSNRNGILDPNETDENRNGYADRGILDYLTVYSREPNTYSNGTARVSIRAIGQTGPFADLLTSTFNSSQASRILNALGVVSPSAPSGPSGPGNPGNPGNPSQGGGAVPKSFTSPLQLFRQSGLTADEFAKIAHALTTIAGETNYIEGRINVNTASAAVLSCLPGFTDNPGLAQTLITYRNQNPTRLTSIAWVVDALGQNNTSVLTSLEATDCITTESYQYTADIAAVGPHGRGYRRVRVVFDTVDGTPKIIYRQDLTHLGWALGKDARQTWLFASKENR